MAENSFPFENVDVSESQFSYWARNFQDNGVNGVPSGTELKVTADGDALAVKVAVGQAFVRGHYYTNSGVITIPISTVGNKTRVDTVVLELDPVANSMSARVVLGDEALSSPETPDLVQTDVGVYQFPLAKIVIPNDTTAITSEMITDMRTFMGRRIGIWTTATRPANPINNFTFGYNATTGFHEVYNNNEWRPFAPDEPTPFLLMGA